MKNMVPFCMNRRLIFYAISFGLIIILTVTTINKGFSKWILYDTPTIKSKPKSNSTTFSEIVPSQSPNIIPTPSPIPLSTLLQPQDAKILSIENEYISKVNEYLKYENIMINKPESNEYISYKELFKENITFLIISCKRFNVLSKSIESFEKYNTYQYISEKVILDDCTNDDEISPMIDKYGINTTYKYKFITNKIPKVSKITGTPTRSVLNQEYLIDHYVANKTNYYFKSEDDWIFYKHGFIEDSFAIKYGAKYWYNKSLLNKDIIHPRKILTASLQNLQYRKLHESTKDVHSTCGGVNDDGIYPQYFTSPILGYNNKTVTYAIEKYFRDCFGSYTNRPTLQHFDDYLLIKNKYGNYTHLGKALIGTAYNPKRYSIGNEKLLACAYKDENYALATTIYNGYCAHGCSSCHVDISEKKFDVNFSGMNDSFILDYEMFTEHCLPKAYYNYMKKKKVLFN